MTFTKQTSIRYGVKRSRAGGYGEPTRDGRRTKRSQRSSPEVDRFPITAPPRVFYSSRAAAVCQRSRLAENPGAFTQSDTHQSRRSGTLRRSVTASPAGVLRYIKRYSMDQRERGVVRSNQQRAIYLHYIPIASISPGSARMCWRPRTLLCSLGAKEDAVLPSHH